MEAIMQTVELNHLKQGDIVAVMFPVNDEGYYTIVTGIWQYYYQDSEEEGTNRTSVYMTNVVYQVKQVVDQVADEVCVREAFDGWDG